MVAERVVLPLHSSRVSELIINLGYSKVSLVLLVSLWAPSAFSQFSPNSQIPASR